MGIGGSKARVGRSKALWAHGEEWDAMGVDLPLASARSGVIRGSWILLSRTRDAAGSY